MDGFQSSMMFDGLNEALILQCEELNLLCEDVD